MNTKQLEYFLELSQVLNYRRASERLGITQPTLSKAIGHLERDLGFPLFAKSGRSICLTAQGKLFIPYAQEGLHHLEQGIRAAMQRETLHLGCIAAVESDLLPAFCCRSLCGCISSGIPEVWCRFAVPSPTTCRTGWKMTSWI